jgi:lysophospholipase L1-like esterase
MMSSPGLRLLLVMGVAPLLVSCAAPGGSPQLVPAGDARFRYEGRFDFADRAQPVVIWEGSRIRLDFDGDFLALNFGAGTDQNYFNAQVDDASEIVTVPAEAESRFVWPHPLGAGRHHLVIFKRSEASAGHAAFRGVELAAGANVWAAPVPDYHLRIEFLGDSITAGACNEDGEQDQWENRRTHNNAFSYAKLTADAFAADYRCTAVSGMGLTPAWWSVPVGEIWNKLYPRADSPRADLSDWRPDVLLVNLGENDDSFNRAHQQPFPAAYTPRYVELIKTIRATWPHTHIVLLRGGMFGGAKSPELRAAWEAVVKEVEAGDPAISHYVFAHWSEQHPRVADHRAMAGELTAWLRGQPFMQRFR